MILFIRTRRICWDMGSVIQPLKRNVFRANAKGELGTVVEVQVKNTGTCAGKEAVLIYAHYEGGTLDQPEHRLVAFGKTCLLQPGERRTSDLDDRSRSVKVLQ